MGQLEKSWCCHDDDETARLREALADEEEAHQKGCIPNAERLEAENARLREALGIADDLLRRLSEWDMFWVDPKTGRASVADGRYWQDQIQKTRATLKETT